MTKIRAFIALPLPRDLIGELAGVQDALKDEPGKKESGFVKPENIHLTLRFLGDINEELVQDIIDELEESAEGFGPITIRLDRPAIMGGRMLILPVQENEELTALKGGVDQRLKKFGFESEKRRFKPHLTLLRIRKKERLKGIARRIKEIDRHKGSPFTANKIILYKSELRPTGAVYTALGEFSLDRT